MRQAYATGRINQVGRARASERTEPGHGRQAERRDGGWRETRRGTVRERDRVGRGEAPRGGGPPSSSATRTGPTERVRPLSPSLSLPLPPPHAPVAPGGERRGKTRVGGERATVGTAERPTPTDHRTHNTTAGGSAHETRAEESGGRIRGRQPPIVHPDVTHASSPSRHGPRSRSDTPDLLTAPRAREPRRRTRAEGSRVEWRGRRGQPRHPQQRGGRRRDSPNPPGGVGKTGNRARPRPRQRGRRETERRPHSRAGRREGPGSRVNTGRVRGRRTTGGNGLPTRDVERGPPHANQGRRTAGPRGEGETSTGAPAGTPETRAGLSHRRAPTPARRRSPQDVSPEATGPNRAPKRTWVSRVCAQG